MWWDKDDLPLTVLKHMLSWPAMQQGLNTRVHYLGRQKFRVLVEGEDEEGMKAYLNYIVVGSPVLGDVSPVACSTSSKLTLHTGATFVNLDEIGQEESELQARKRKIEESGIVPETEDDGSEGTEDSDYLPDAQELVCWTE